MGKGDVDLVGADFVHGEAETELECFGILVIVSILVLGGIKWKEGGKEQCTYLAEVALSQDNTRTIRLSELRIIETTSTKTTGRTRRRRGRR